MSTADLPALNAMLNSIVVVLLVIGLRHIKARRIAAHKRTMIAALVVSALFLTSYLIYHYLHGSRRFEGPPGVRSVYLVILVTHVIGAMVNLPMIIVTVWRAAKEQFDKHRRIAKYTWALWMYVSITGVVVYMMLYQLWPGGSEAFAAAQAHHRAGRDAEALVLYRAAAENGHRGATCFAAIVGDRIEDTDTASAAIASALAEKPDEISCLTLSGQQLVQTGRARQALPVLERATQLAESDFAFATLGYAQFRLQEYRAAAASFERSIALDATLTANIYNAGYAYFLHGNYKAAKPLFERALEAGLEAELEQRARRELALINGALWACPMHAHVTGKAGDTCSECKMALEPFAKGLAADDE